MSSGKFGVDDIELIGQQAFQTFVNLFGVPDAEPQRIAAQAAPARDNYAQQERAAIQAEPPRTHAPSANLKEPAAVDGKPFRVWQNDKLKLGKDKPGPAGKPWAETTWAEAHQSLGGRSPEKARKWLEFLSQIEDKDPRWAASNATMRNRALSLLESASRDGDRDEEPF